MERRKGVNELTEPGQTTRAYQYTGVKY